MALAYGGLTDDQIAAAYGADGLYRSGSFGQGVTVGLYELEPFSTADLSTFDTCYFGGAAAPSHVARVQVRNVDGGAAYQQGSGEAALDVEDVAALAPQANVDVYEGPPTINGFFDTYSAMVNDDKAKVISSSWGLCESVLSGLVPGILGAENVLFEQAAAQGQSILAASGDSGDDECADQSPVPTSPVMSVGDTAGQPFVTAVGGTTITDASQPPTEHVWNDGDTGGAGNGGISDVWPMPSWQRDATVPGIADPTTIAAGERYGSTTFCASARRRLGPLP